MLDRDVAHALGVVVKDDAVAETVGPLEQGEHALGRLGARVFEDAGVVPRVRVDLKVRAPGIGVADLDGLLERRRGPDDLEDRPGQEEAIAFGLLDAADARFLQRPDVEGRGVGRLFLEFGEDLGEDRERPGLALDLLAGAGGR